MSDKSGSASAPRPLRVMFLISGDRIPSSRFRVLAFVNHLEAAGIHCHIAPSFPQKYDYFSWLGFRPSQYLKRLTRFWHLLLARVRSYDVVFVERELFNDPTTSMEARFRRVARRMVLDMDDAVFLRFPEKVEQLARFSDLVIAGNSWIADRMRGWNPNLVVIPTGVELARFPIREKVPQAARPVIGWIGTTANLQYLEVAAPALRRLAQRWDYELRLVVPELSLPDSVDLQGVRVEHVAWDPATEVRELSRFDIGIMPLFSDREWDKYKCPTKLIQYMAVGVPAVASPVGFTGEVISHGVDGFCARSAEEWETALDQLLQDSELRQRIGAAGRRTAAEKYSVEANWPVLAQALRSVASEEAHGDNA